MEKTEKNKLGFSSDEIRFLYVQDPSCPERTVAIARALVDTTLYVAWCVNKVDVYTGVDDETLQGGTHSKYRATTVHVHDRFTKGRARQILRGRLMEGRMRCANGKLKIAKLEHVDDKTKCAQTVLAYVADGGEGVPFVAVHAVRLALRDREKRSSQPYASLVAAFGDEMLLLSQDTALKLWDCVDLAGKVIESSPPEAIEGIERVEIPASQ